MKKLYIVRHAKASNAMDFIDDIERPLTERGFRDAIAVSRKVVAEKIKPELLISSPAIRAFSTAVLFAGRLKYDPGKIMLDHNIYEAHVSGLKKIIESFPGTLSSVMLFGHNPGFNDLVNFLIHDEISHLPTSGSVAIDLAIDSWNEIHSHCGQLRFFKYPDGAEIS